MSQNRTDRVSVDLTATEAALVVAALRRYEPYWSPDVDDVDRADLLAEMRTAIDHVVSSLQVPA